VSTGASPRPPASVTLRSAGPEDCRRIWLWRNDEETRRASFDSSAIPFETHARWFEASLGRPDRRIYVVEVDGTAAGMVRLDVEGRQAVVSINLAPEWRGRGVGPLALRGLAELAFALLGLQRLEASVKADNHASVAAFERAGFASSAHGATVTLHRSRGNG
jgi:UDP-2,4-diacetamido-2,4,6-trideoxy-beta-L-altropyranose hydrolase